MSQYSKTRFDSNSSESTTLSEFVRRRYTGETAVFGGNPATGAREFGTAVHGSVGNFEVVSAMSKLTSALQSFGGLANRAPLVHNEESLPIAMVQGDPSVVAMNDAIKLDDEKIRLLLAASYIEPKDTQRYATLFGLARESMAKKLSAVKAHSLRKEAKLQPGLLMKVDEIVAIVGEYQGRVDETKALFGLKDTGGEFDKLIAVALTHDSFTDGRETNRVLAFLGDAAMKCAAASWAFDSHRSVSDLNDLVQMTQNNTKLRDSAVGFGLHNQVLVKHGVDPAAKLVVATAFEAVLGAIFLEYGIGAVADSMIKFSLFETNPATPKVGHFSV